MSNAAVRVREVDGVDLTPLLQIRAMFQGRGMLTGPDGTLDLPGLAPGRYEIEVRWQDRVATDTTRVRAAADNEITIDLR